MEFQRINTTSKLFPYVESFWVLESHVEEKDYVDFKEYGFFANPFPQMAFQYLGKGFLEISIKKKSSPIPLCHFYGQTSEPINIATFGSFGLIGVNFYPYSIPHLFNISSKHTTGKTMELKDFFGEPTDEIIKQVLDADDNAIRVDYLVTLLEKFVDEAAQRDPIIEAAIQFSLANKGQESIDSLCEYLGYSVRQVERSFKEKIGISPKLYSRMIRFHNAIRNYHSKEFENLSQLALYSGFSDQAHFIREFRHFSGLNPRHYFKKLDAELTFIKHI